MNEPVEYNYKTQVDPGNNGLELNAGRPRDQRIGPDGKLRMVTDPFYLEDF